MTKEQEQAILNAFNDAFSEIAPVDKLISGAVLAAIKAYDEQVNGTAKTQESDHMIIYSKLNQLPNSKIFGSKDELFEKLNEKYSGKVVLSHDGFVYILDNDTEPIGLYTPIKKG